MLLASIPPIIFLGALSFFQESKMTKNSQLRIINNLTQSTNSQILNKVREGNSILETITFNQAFGAGFDEFSKSTNKYNMFLFLSRELDPTIKFIQTVNPDLDNVLFFTDSNLETSRQDIYSLKEASLFPFKDAMHYSQTYQWYIDEDYVYGIGQIPKTFAQESFTTVALRYEKKDFFKDLNLSENSLYAEIKDDNQLQYTMGEKIASKKIITTEKIPGTSWSIDFFASPKERSLFDRISKTLIAIVFSAFISFLLATIFVNYISSNFRKLEEKIKIFNLKKMAPNLFYTKQKDDFGKLSNSVADMLVQFDQTKNQLHSFEIQNEKSRYDALVNQINSHFLYNTLSMINWKAIDLENKEISLAVQELSKFYRTTLNKGKSITSLKNELENIRAYIYLQLMLNDNFQVSYNIDQSLLYLDTINLLLQPIVENSIEHGFVKTKENWKIYITIRSENEDEIAILVGDNGIGIPKDKIPKILTDETQGYGLRNLNQRIKFVFGKKYGLKISSKLGIGTLIKITLPKKRPPIQNGDQSI